MAKIAAWFIIAIASCGISTVFGRCETLEAPKDLMMSLFEGRSLLVRWTAPENQETCDITYNLRIFQDGIAAETIETTLTEHLTDWPGSCTQIDAILYAKTTDDVTSGLVVTNWYTGAPTEVGIVENRLIEVNESSVVITFEPPAGSPNCRFVYEMIYSLDGAVVYSGLTAELIHSFNYVEAKLLCKVLYMQLTAVTGGVRGDTYDNNVFTDKFDIDLGEVSDLSLTVNDVLEISWNPPEYYESCPVTYALGIRRSQDGEELFFMHDMFYSWVFDPSDQDLYCLKVVVTLTPYMRGIQGIPTSEEITFGPPPSGTC